MYKWRLEECNPRKNEAEKGFTEVLGRQGGRIIKHKLIFKERARSAQHEKGDFISPSNYALLSRHLADKKSTLFRFKEENALSFIPGTK